VEKPLWRVRASSYVVDTPYLRLRKDEVELPDGTIVPDYFVRESNGFAIVFAITTAGTVLLSREYRYGSDTVGIELPAGTLDANEDPLACAQRELREETGYEAAEYLSLGTFFAEPVRSNARAYLFLARGARKVGEQVLDATEHIDVIEVSLDELRAMIRDGRMNSLSAVATAYRAFDVLSTL
jgi:8-oxo-dGTP pyrophosphatase MutT (NUDIX family)